MTTRRPWGSGTVEAYRGRHRARLRGPNNTRPVLGIYDTADEAQRMLDAFHVAAASEPEPWTGQETVRSYGKRFLDARELSKLANWSTDRSRWKRHVEKAEFIDWPLVRVERRHVKDFILKLNAHVAATGKKRAISYSTRKHIRNLLRSMFASAVDDGLLTENPARLVKLVNEGETEEGWTYLTPPEQKRLANCKDIPLGDRYRIRFAQFSGLRQGEQWNLELRDLHHEDAQPHVVVRKGSAKGATKSRKIRRVALIPAAVQLLREWLQLLPRYAPKNPHALVWPTVGGYRRQKGKVYGFKEQLKAAGIKRPVRWHDLRHTCGSSLIAGWWGKEWSLPQVRDLLGHSSITQTERYSHLAPSVVSEAAAKTDGQQLAITTEAFERESSGNPAARPAGFEPATLGFEGRVNPSDLQGLGALDGQLVAKSTQYLRAVASRNRHAKRYAEELAGAVLALTVVQLAQGVLEGGALTFSSATRLAEAILAAAEAAPAKKASGA